MYYYFAFANDDPLKTAFNENEITVDEMRERFVGSWVRVGDDEHDVNQVSDIWTSDQAKKYFEE